MPVKITSSFSHFWLDSWLLANILQLGTQSFCDRFLTRDNDPGGRLYDQMVMAARSVVANIAEGSARKDTSVETEMKLTDVARASLPELQGDYFNILIRHGNHIWSTASPELAAFNAIRLDEPRYGDDLMRDLGDYILAQKRKFDPFIESPDRYVAANALMFLCMRIIKIVKGQLKQQHRQFLETGGFAENMTADRLEARKAASQAEQAPVCAQCGAPMIKRTCQRGSRSGKQFWSCSNYHKTGCNYTINID